VTWLKLPPKVADRFDPDNNGLTAVRLVLALSVLVLHAWPVGGFGDDPIDSLTGGRLGGGGTLAVAAFFGLSGFLLVESRKRQSRKEFAWRRARRILPAYWLAIGLGALIVGPWYIAAAWSPFPLVGAVSWEGWSGHPLPFVNASLWTLGPEIICYTILACLPRRHIGIGLSIVFAAVVSMAVLGYLTPEFIRASVPLTTAFVTGGLIALAKVRVPLSGVVAAAGVALGFVMAGTVAGQLLLSASVAYAAIWAAAWLPLRLTPDFSYGTYVFAFPVTQLLFAAGLANFGVWPLALSTVAVTVPLAAASWFLVERRALRLRVGGMRLHRRSDAVASTSIG
jgi:peptidoglycan/LPS O-acetylase OafA/YrhL